MKGLTHRLSLMGAAVLAGSAAFTSGGPTAALAATSPVPQVAPVTSGRLPTAAPRIETLPSGDRVLVTRAGHGMTTASPIPDPVTHRVTPMHVLSMGGHTYAVPAADLTKLGPNNLASYDVGVARATPRPAILGTRTDPRRYPMHTVTIRAINAQGRSASPLTDGLWGAAFNLDNAHRLNIPIMVFNLHGVAKVSVPGGHYYFELTLNNVKRPGEVRTVQRNVTVTGDPVVTLDSRAATVTMSASADQPIGPQTLILNGGRIDKAGVGGSVSLNIGTEAAPPRISPMRQVTLGQAFFSFAALLTPPTDAADQSYSYDLMRASEGHLDDVPVALVGDRTTNAALVQRLYSPTPGQAVTDYLIGNYSTMLTSVVGFAPAQSVHTAYVLGDPLVKVGMTYSTPISDSGPTSPWYYASPRAYAPGERVTENWGKAPLNTAMPEVPIGKFLSCAACMTSDNVLTLGMSEFGDSDLNHATFYSPWANNTQSGHWEFGIDGVTWLQFAGAPAIWASMPSLSGELELTSSQTGALSGGTTPSTVDTSWIMPPGLAGTTPAPGHWWCWPYKHGGGKGCDLITFLRAQVDLPVGLDNRLPLGPVSGTIRVTELGQTNPVSVASATVELSYDAGASWVPATTTINADTVGFDATPPAGLAPGAEVALRLRVADVTGRSVSQQVTTAFTFG